MSTHVKRLHKLSGHRFLLALSLVMAMLAFSLMTAQPLKAGAATKARACPSQTIEQTYYTDASMTTACGWRIITCSCGSYSSGCRTAYYTTEWSEC
jgi:predicted membrane protein